MSQQNKLQPSKQKIPMVGMCFKEHGRPYLTNDSDIFMSYIKTLPKEILLQNKKETLEILKERTNTLK